MPSRAERVKQLFEQALDLPEERHAAFLAEACPGEPDLQREVADLLSALAAATGFLAERRDPTATEQPGTTVDGRFELMERLGEGGFGVVFRARQLEPLQRDVALKILKLGLHGRSATARFEQERQALARMQHPNIAAVYDGGTTASGRPYFAMELVDGKPITEYCREHGLGIGERVDLVIAVCLAVQHAHLKGIVHRDLKPANILVARSSDQRPLPKVIDFGIAKALDPDVAHPDFTGTLHGQPIGTLEYMPPEQALGRLDELDSRADVYSLGVVLYELLAGRRPFERGDHATGIGADGMVSRIRDEAPRRPSTRVAQGDRPVPLPGADRSRWSRALHGDLDWIIDRALQKNPDDRYPTPNALATDLRNFRSGMPVSAGPPTAGYVLRRFLGRHRAAALGSTTLLLSILIGFVATSLALADARAASASKSRTVAALRTLLLTADPHALRGPDHSVRAMLDEFAPHIAERFASDPDVALELHVTVGGAYRNLSQLESARGHLDRAVALARTAGDALPLERALIEQTALRRELGDLRGAAESAEEALGMARARNPRSPRVGQLMLTRADLYRLADDPRQGEALVQPALALLPRNNVDPRVLAQRAFGLDLLGAFALRRGTTESAKAHFEAARAARTRCFAPDHPMLATSDMNLAAVHRTRGALGEARRAAERALANQSKAFGARHPQVAATHAFLGGLALQQNDLPRAREHLGRALEVRKAVLPAGHPDLASTFADLGRLELQARRPADAERHLRCAVELGEAAGGTSRAFAGAIQNLGIAVERQGRLDAAVTLYQRALRLHRALGNDNPGIPGSLTNLGMLTHRRGDPSAAVPLLREAVELRRSQAAAAGELLNAETALARAAKAAGDLRTAAVAQRARVALMTELGNPAGQIAATRAKAARLFLDAGDAAAAKPLAAAAHAYCTTEIPDQWPTGDSAAMLAACLLAEGKCAEAARHADAAWSLLRRSPAPVAYRRRCLEVLVSAHRGAAAATADEAQRTDHRHTADRAKADLAAMPGSGGTGR
ncbi:MAG: serine/threonine protein kinase [Planctomycetes bacterium]|nr:serine/threonine protein kinase [Planctomycetota bacterium]